MPDSGPEVGAESVAPAEPVAVKITKPELKQISNYVGVGIAILGQLAPVVSIVMPALGVPAWGVKLTSALIGAALVAYREKQTVTAPTGVSK